MGDKFSKEIRSYVMSRIRGKDTKAELAFRKMLFSEGIRYRLHYPIEGSRPDVAIPSKKIAIFIDGCFWHKCPKCFRPPKSRESYWTPKIQKNLERDIRIRAMLRAKGWKVIRVWEHEVNKKPQKAIKRVLIALSKTKKCSKCPERYLRLQSGPRSRHF